MVRLLKDSFDQRALVPKGGGGVRGKCEALDLATD
jgi:hypothetical protein